MSGAERTSIRCARAGIAGADHRDDGRKLRPRTVDEVRHRHIRYRRTYGPRPRLLLTRNRATRRHGELRSPGPAPAVAHQRSAQSRRTRHATRFHTDIREGYSQAPSPACRASREHRSPHMRAETPRSTPRHRCNRYIGVTPPETGPYSVCELQSSTAPGAWNASPCNYNLRCHLSGGPRPVRRHDDLVPRPSGGGGAASPRAFSPTGCGSATSSRSMSSRTRTSACRTIRTGRS
jgi:hypothetical protein